ncbi:DNA cytosine methyltransferase [Paracoccus stylophorae]|uniref:DNA cytosine methyltransferase n=1 Tax=Paracoccus stylophorae TaxID=659350 RepID=A0ABY7SS64_9RHOB|nr:MULTISPECIES: DNA cytosine methyltransferase [Paracoccus]WCR09872.1 DNA cytosine methyltransferase [Paracoccus stylophorae]WEF25896.1 DNA cytosine methyltransferase [Paracoccus sp. S3-43]
MSVYYNDADPAACAWLRELIAAGLLPRGEVDGRSIMDVEPADLRGFMQCHFFAGIGGWPYALRLAGVAEDLSVWTGSPPCQPFSVAGQRKGQDDDRHLAPAFLQLVAACRPNIVFGEQVASAAVLGPVCGAARAAAEGPAGWAWFDALADALEAASYAVAAADLPAAGIGAPHIRQRLFFGAVAMEGGGLGHGFCAGSQGRIGMPGGADQRAARPTGLAGGLVDHDADLAGASATDGVWRDPDWLLCRDDRWRPVEPGTFPLADGIPRRMGLLRGYGNAIVPPLAAEFVRAFLESLPERLR